MDLKRYSLHQSPNDQKKAARLWGTDITKACMAAKFSISQRDLEVVEDIEEIQVLDSVGE